MEQVQELSDLGHASQAEMLKMFLNEIQSGSWELGANAEQSFLDWKNDKLKNEISVFADKWNIDKEILFKSFTLFDLKEPNNIPRIDEVIDSINYEAEDPFIHRFELLQKLPEWMKKLKRKYDE